MNSHIKWDLLREHLCDLPETGESGFEGFAAKLVGLMTGETLRLAATGWQSAGDASSEAGTISIQAKRYNENTALKGVEILGDIDRISLSNKGLEVYVLAATRSIPSQLRALLNAKEEDSGIDVVTLGFGDVDPDIGVLSLHYWGKLRETPFFADASPSLTEWMSRHQGDVQIMSAAANISRNIVDRWNTWLRLFEHSDRHLERRFSSSNSADALYPIDLVSAIHRKALTNQIAAWWIDESPDSSLIAVVEGEEGCGKSWGTAQAVYHLHKQHNVPVFWLDSYIWANAKTLQDVVCLLSACATDLKPGAESKYTKKILHGFSHSVLFVLDGANERVNVVALADFLRRIRKSNADSRHVRLVITTRPLVSSDSLWHGCLRIGVAGYSDAELETLLAQNHQPKIAQLPTNLLPVLRLPRYFSTALRLKDRLQSVFHITREILLWEELKDKIERMDHQVRKRLGFQTTADAAYVLSSMARHATPEGRLTDGKADALLQKCFSGKYSEIRHDLVEVRISSDAGLAGPTVTKDVLVLGWALYLLSVLSHGQIEVPVTGLVSALQKELEPIPSDDCRTEALFVALLLTCLRDITSARRAALLFVWYTSHNPGMRPERLEFWTSKDLFAYLLFIETLFSGTLTHGNDLKLIYPLARMWKGQDEGYSSLKETLDRWIMLVWRWDAVETTLTEGVHRLPVAVSQFQLRLSDLAVSIISQRPDNDMLPALAIGAATQMLSKSFENGHEHPCKFMGRDLRALMWWVYTDTVLPTLEDLLADAGDDEVLREGYRLLADYLGIADPPLALRRPPPPPNAIPPFVPTVDAIRLWKSPFKDHSGNRNCWFNGLELLAIRSDLPELTEEAKSEMTGCFAGCCAMTDDEALRNLTRYNLDRKAVWPWMARQDPERFRGHAFKLLLARLGGRLFHDTFYDFRDVILTRTREEKDAFGSALRGLRESCETPPGGVRTESFNRLEHLFELLILNGGEDDLIEWIGWIARFPPAHLIPEVYPAHQALRASCSGRLSAFFLSRLLNAMACLSSGEPPGASAEVTYWARLLSHDENLVLPENELESLWRSAEDSRLSADARAGLYGVLAHVDTARLVGAVFESRFLGLDKRSFLNVLRRIRRFFDNIPPNVGADSVRLALPIDCVGNVLCRMKLIPDFDEWVSELLRIALSLAAETPADLPRGVKCLMRIGDGPRLSLAYTSASGPDRTVSFGEPPACDSASDNEIAGRLLESGESGTATKEGEDPLVRTVRHLNQWNGASFDHFWCSDHLLDWARIHLGDFREFAAAYLAAIESREDAGFSLTELSLSSLTFQVVRTWNVLSIQGDLTVEAYRKMISDTRYSGDHGIDVTVLDLWSGDALSSGRLAELRRNQAFACKNDEELMLTAMAAMTCNTTRELRDLARDLLASPQACVRNLAVSLVAWVADDETVSLMRTLWETDPNDWVRDHARWGHEIALQEQSCRSHYRKIIDEPDAVNVSAMLQVMEPALLPPCRLWHEEIEEAAGFWQRKDNPRKTALLKAFWYDWGNLSSHKSNISAFGRKLTEWHRGYKKESFTSDRMYPWWQV